jgi:hypothetical protein
VDEWKEAAQKNMSKTAELESKLEGMAKAAEAAREEEVQKREAAEAAAATAAAKGKELEAKVAAEAVRLEEQVKLEKRVEALGRELHGATKQCKKLEVEKARAEREGIASLTKAETARAAAKEAMRTEMEGVRARLSS